MKPEDLINHRALELFPKTEQSWIDMFGKVAVEGQPAQFTNYSIELDKYYETRIYCPRPGYFAALFSDVSEQKKAEESLRESTAKLETMIQVSPLAITLVDLNGIIQLWNSAAERIFGWTAQEVIGHQNPIVPAIKQNEYNEWSDQIVKQGKILSDQEAIRQRKDGSLINVSISSSPMYDGFGNVVGRMAILADISARKQVEKALRESEEHFHSLYDNAMIGIYRTTPDGHILLSNPAGMRMLGYDSLEEIAKRDLEKENSKSGYDRSQFRERMQRDGIITGLESAWKRKDGSTIYVRESAVTVKDSDGNIIYYDGTFEDITERKKAEEALHESEERFASLSKSTFEGIVFNDKGIVIDCNEQFIAMFGYERTEIIGAKVSKFIAPESREEVTANIQSGSEESYEHLSLRKDGSKFPVEIRAKSLPYKGLMVRVTTIRDITERKQAEEAIRKSEEKFSKAFRGSPEAITIASMEDGRYIEVNDIFLKTTGFKSDEVIGRTSTELNVWVNASDRRRFVEELSKKGYLKNFEVQYRMRNGEIRDFIVSSDIIELEGKPCSLNFILDVTERKQAEEQIQKQLERLNALRNIDDAIKSSDDLRFTLKVFLGEVAAQLKVDAASVLLFNKNSLTLDYAAGHGFHSSVLQHTKLGSSQGYAGQVVLDRKTIHIPDLTKVENKLTEALSLAGENFAAYIGTPLIAKGQVVGVLEIFQRSPLTPVPEWLSFLNMLASQAAIAVDNAQLFENLQKSNFDLTFAYDATIEGWSRAMDLRDKETEGHTQRVTSLTVKLAQQMGIPDSEIIHIRRGALLHDIGKMGIPDNILLKPGQLTPQEWDIMRQHTIYAYEMLLPIHYLRPALDIPQYHHERWDGTGYPHKLKSEDIPLPARIFAVVDVWDAVTSDRPYRKSWTKKKALEHIKSESGKHFDPKVVEMFLSLVSSHE
jgi:PAS domain S-box-containing protein/putative nucleotidyltransferase with HDIG domain